MSFNESRSTILILVASSPSRAAIENARKRSSVVEMNGEGDLAYHFPCSYAHDASGIETMTFSAIFDLTVLGGTGCSGEVKSDAVYANSPEG